MFVSYLRNWMGVELSNPRPSHIITISVQWYSYHVECTSLCSIELNPFKKWEISPHILMGVEFGA